MAPECTRTEALAEWSIIVAGKTTEKGSAVVGSKETTPDQLCTVGVALKRTVNLGNYESAQVSVSLSAPCKPNEIGKMFTFSKGWCEGKLIELLGPEYAEQEKVSG